MLIRDYNLSFLKIKKDLTVVQAKYAPNPAQDQLAVLKVTSILVYTVTVCFMKAKTTSLVIAKIWFINNGVDNVN